MTEENSYLVPYRPSTIPPGTGPYPAGTPWADPDLDAAAERMRAVVRDPASAQAKAQQALADIEERHTPAAAVSFVRARLDAGSPTGHAAPTEPLDRAVYELMWGPDLERARPWSRRLRMAVAPILRPYADQQRMIGTLLAEAIRDRASSDD
jgi:hypothetical protein